VSLFRFPQIHHTPQKQQQQPLVQLSAFGSGGDQNDFGYNQGGQQFNQQGGQLNKNTNSQFNQYAGGGDDSRTAAGEYLVNDAGIAATGAGGEADVEGRVSQLLDEINEFCQGTNYFWRSLVPPVMRQWLAILPAGSAATDPISKLRAGPELPGIPRPVWLVILGCFPTVFNWYGLYKFNVEEELYYYELERTGRVTTCGGYGTLVPFIYGVFIGLPLLQLDIPGGQFILEAAVIWLLLGQINQYRRVNELCQEARLVLELEGDGRMLYEWWAALPPPFNVLVALRSIYFLSEYWRVVRGELPATDYIAEDIFPSVGEKRRFTVKEFLREPSRWYWFTKNLQFPIPPYLQDDDDRFEPRNY